MCITHYSLSEQPTNLLNLGGVLDLKHCLLQKQNLKPDKNTLTQCFISDSIHAQFQNQPRVSHVNRT